MEEWSFLGKNCRDIVSGFEGICVGMMEWLYGCVQLKLQPKGTTAGKQENYEHFFAKQLEVLDDGIIGKIEIPEYTPPKFFGKECLDKVVGIKGMCVGRMISLFNADMYMIESLPEDDSKAPRMLWIDEGRLEIVGEKEIEPEEVQSSRTGGEFDAYPCERNIVR